MKTRRGFTLIEIVVALALAALFLPAIARLYTFAIGTSSQGDKYSKAYALAQMNMEDIYNQKKNWEDSGGSWPTSLNSGASYYQRRIGSSCSSSYDLNLTDKYMDLCQDEKGFWSYIKIEEVRRFVNGELGGPSEPVDTESKKIISIVLWGDISDPEEVSISSYVTKH